MTEASFSRAIEYEFLHDLKYAIKRNKKMYRKILVSRLVDSRVFTLVGKFSWIGKIEHGCPSATLPIFVYSKIRRKKQTSKGTRNVLSNPPNSHQTHCIKTSSR